MTARRDRDPNRRGNVIRRVIGATVLKTITLYACGCYDVLIKIIYYIIFT